MKRFILQTDDSAPEVNYSIAYDDHLNEQQYKAVFHDEGPLLVVAGAGTGKTRTLIYRVARLIEAGVDPSEILLLTFTRRAASEMLTRSSTILDARCKRVKGGTFHFYCSQLLHRYASNIGYNEQFTIIDRSDAIEMLELVEASLNIDKSSGRFPRRQTIYAILSKAVNKQADIETIINEYYPQFRHQIKQIKEIQKKYSIFKKQQSLMDFDDLLTNTIALMESDTDLAKKIAYNHRHVMVDEYQDVNSLQAKLAKLFSSVHGNLMVVGDDAQSIYGFRGAEHENIMEFPDEFEQTRVIKLEKNYRSTQPILDFANYLIEQSKNQYSKKLYSKSGEGELPALVKADTVEKQSRFITQMVLNLREQEYDLNDLAVLFRNGRDSYELEIALNQKNIPFVKYGGQKFTEAAHIKDVLAHLRVLVNREDIVAWNRILTMLDGVGPKTAQDLYEWITSTDIPLEFSKGRAVNKRYTKQLQFLGTTLQQADQFPKNPSRVIKLINSYYRTFCEKRFDDYPKRLKDLEALEGIAEKYNSLPDMIEELTLDPIEMSTVDVESEEKDEPPLVLSTIHSAKGLEWSAVFIIQCLDGIIPSAYALDDPKELEEELRLFYVACTRAIEYLFISYPIIHATNQGDYFTKPSRFVDGVDETLLEPWILVEDSSDKLPQQTD